jgi:hypothetical protein
MPGLGKPQCYEEENKCDACPYRHTCKKRRRYVPYAPWQPTTPDPPYMPTIWMRCGE